MTRFVFGFELHWSVFLEGPIGNMSALVQVMAWHRTGDKALHEPMLTQYTDAYLWHMGRWVKWPTDTVVGSTDVVYIESH